VKRTACFIPNCLDFWLSFRHFKVVVECEVNNGRQQSFPQTITQMTSKRITRDRIPVRNKWLTFSRKVENQQSRKRCMFCEPTFRTDFLNTEAQLCKNMKHLNFQENTLTLTKKNANRIWHYDCTHRICWSVVVSL